MAPRTAETILREFQQYDGLAVDPLWKQARNLLTDPTKEVLVLGPQKTSPFGEVTEAVVAYLRHHGIQSCTFNPALSVTQHRTAAEGYEFILGIPISVGTAAEVVDFMGNPVLSARLVVVLPKDHGTSYIARIAHERLRKATLCGKVTSRTIDPEIGFLCITALAEAAVERLQSNAAEAERNASSGQDSHQAKVARALESGATPIAAEPDEELLTPPSSSALDDDDFSLGEAEPPGPSIDGGDGWIRRFFRGVALVVVVVAALLLFRFVGAVVGSVILVLVAAVVLACVTIWRDRGYDWGPTRRGRVGNYVFELFRSSAESDDVEEDADP